MPRKSKVAKSSNGKPKRPLSAFFRFCKERRPELKLEHPEASAKEIAKMLGEEWRSLSESTKNAYKKESKRELEEYKKMYPKDKIEKSGKMKKVRKSAKKLINKPKKSMRKSAKKVKKIVMKNDESDGSDESSSSDEEM